VAIKTLFIVNPKSGNGRGLQYADRAKKVLKAHGQAVDIRYTTARGEAEALARHAVQQGISVIVACGGDGTVHEVINAVAGAEVRFGILPCGRGNDFARAAGIPPEPEAAAKLLCGGNVSRLDLGRVNGRYFATVVTLGFDSEVAKLVYDGAVPFKGTAAYLYGALRLLCTYEGIEMTASGDFGTINQQILLAATGNTSTYGGGLIITPKADPTDGKLDICIVRMMKPAGVLRLLPKVYWGGHLGHPSIFTYRTTRLELNTGSPVVLFADGEPVGETPAEIISAPGALLLLCPGLKPEEL